MAERLFLEEKKIIEEIVEKQDCVIVGRCADYALRHDPRLVKIFIYSLKQISQKIQEH